MSERAPAVSVIIPTYNRADLVGRAIKSVLSQTYQDFEIIVVDDASVDNTEEAVKGFDDPRIRYMRHEQNRGGSAARNTGIRAAKGKYIAFLDSDDRFEPMKIAAQIDVFNRTEDKNMVLVYTGCRSVELQSGKVRGLTRPRKRGNIHKEILLANCVGTTSSILVKADIVREIGGFDESLPANQDWELYFRLSKDHAFDYVDEYLTEYGMHPVRISNRDANARSRDFHMFKSYLFSRLKEQSYCFRQKAKSMYYYRTGRRLAFEGSVGRRLLLKAVILWPLNFKGWAILLVSALPRKVVMQLRKAKRILYDRCSGRT
jgi:glycosyltransferase involved in cell wall biosynthesis